MNSVAFVISLSSSLRYLHNSLSKRGAVKEKSKYNPELNFNRVIDGRHRDTPVYKLYSENHPNILSLWCTFNASSSCFLTNIWICFLGRFTSSLKLSCLKLFFFFLLCCLRCQKKSCQLQFCTGKSNHEISKIALKITVCLLIWAG